MDALRRIAPLICKTPVLTSDALNLESGLKLFFKCENFQRTGAFKIRGASNAVLKAIESGRMPDEGVVTYSTGNHGIALATVCNKVNVHCTVVIGRDTPKAKREKIANLGAEVIVAKSANFSEQIELAKKAETERGKYLIHTSDNEDVVEGASTVAFEMKEQIDEDLDVVMAPLAGGGLLSGLASVFESAIVVPVEPKGKNLALSLKAEKRLWDEPPKFIATSEADAINMEPASRIPFEIMLRTGVKPEDVISLTDSEMADGCKMAAEKLKIVCELSSGSAIFAAVKRLKTLRPDVKSCGVVVSGGNVDFIKYLKYIA